MDVLASQSVLVLQNQSESENDWMILIMKVLEVSGTLS